MNSIATKQDYRRDVIINGASAVFFTLAVVVALTQFTFLMETRTIISCLCTPIIFRDDAVVRVPAPHQCGPGSIPKLGVICGLNLLVLFSATSCFSSGGSGFFLSPKPTFDLIC